MSESVKDLVKEIKEGLSQTSSSRKDEVRVMKAMLNDPSYEVDEYGKDGVVGTYNPCKDFRNMCASVISSAAKVPQAEAANMMETYEVKKSEASSMVNISKEFVNAFLHTGRKLPMGAREKSDVSLSLKVVAPSTRLYPKKVGISDDGASMYSKVGTTVPAHEAIRVHAPCPSWVK